MTFFVYILPLVIGAFQPYSVSQQPNVPTHQAPAIADIAFYDLMANPAQYAGQAVRVRAVYRYGFEWSQLYSLRCGDDVSGSRVWVDFADGFEGSTKRSIRRQLSDEGFGGRTVGVVAVGTIQQGRFGHMGAYNLRFVIQRIEEAATLDHESASPGSLSEQVRRKIGAFEAGHR